MCPVLSGLVERTRLIQDLICLLRRCRQRRCTQEAKRLHACIRDQDLELHPILGNYLVPVLTECGRLQDAQSVFDRLLVRNVYSWTSLIAGYIDHSQPQHAFGLYHQMLHEDCVLPTRVTYLSLLSACTGHKDVEFGRGLHADILKRGLENELFNGSAAVGNTLVDMYGKCGLILDAHQVFDCLPARDIVSWNALITGYAEQRLGQEAGNCLYQMQLDGFAPDLITFISSLKSWGSIGALGTGHQIHSEITSRGLESELQMGSMLADMYGKCDSMLDAHDTFKRLHCRNEVSWNVLVSGYAQCGLCEQAVDCVQQMQLEGISPDAVTFLCCLKSCATTKSLEKGHQLHLELAKVGLERELNVGNTLVDMYIKCCSPAEATKVFNLLPKRDAISWNALIAGYADQGYYNEVLTCFRKMQVEGVSADTVTFVHFLKACGTLGALEIGREIHAEIRKLGLERVLPLSNILIDMYGKCSSVAEGRKVFDRLPTRCVVTWNAMIQAYTENHENNMAVECFDEMQEQGVKPDSITFTCVLAACSHASLVLKGQQFFKMMTETHKIEPMLDHYVCMIDLFARSGQLYEAGRFVAAMQCPPSREIFVTLLSASKVYGEVELGHRCFQHLIEENQDFAASYLLMADIYSSANRFSDAKRVEELRKYAEAKKKPGSALIEVNKTLRTFSVAVDQSKDSLGEIEFFTLRMKEAGYIPSLCDVSMHVCNQTNEETSYEDVDNPYIMYNSYVYRTGLNDNVLFGMTRLSREGNWLTDC